MASLGSFNPSLEFPSDGPQELKLAMTSFYADPALECSKAEPKEPKLTIDPSSS